MIKLVLGLLVIFITNISVFAFEQTDISPFSAGSTKTAVQTTTVDGLLTFVKDSIFGLLAMITIGVFIFIGIRLVIARGNAEEFKKSLLQLVYAIVGLFVVSIAYLAVKLVSGLSIN